MSQSLDIIHDEHRALAAMLSSLRSLAGAIAAGRLKPDFGLFADMLRYIEEVPEKLHHPKETDYLFARLRPRCPEAEPVIARLVEEHRQGEARMAVLKDALEAYRTRGEAGFEGFNAALLHYIDQEWKHMNTEEKQIFPLARQHLTAADWTEIDAAFLANDNPWQGAAGEYAALFTRIVNEAPAPSGSVAERAPTNTTARPAANTIMDDTPSFTWDDRYLLGHPAMDDTHREFVECVQALLSAPDAQLPAALDAFARHARAHFGEEDRWMADNGFPAADCHMDEHARVLASVAEVQAALATGDSELVRELGQALQAWFPAHADYLDSALAQWLVKRSHGGAPLVFRRAPAPG